jgi:2,3-bisphosphoglycerate-dependent phosphoglycerate mutase
MENIWKKSESGFDTLDAIHCVQCIQAITSPIISMRLLCIRHAQSIGNPEGVMLGQWDPDLTSVGITQSQILAAALVTGVWRPTHVYTSPLRRSQQTAEIAIAALTELGHLMSLQVSPELQEINLGIFQGIRWDEACDRYPELCRQLEQSSHWLEIPGAESSVEIHQRAVRFLQGLRDRHSQADQLWIFSHGGFLQYLVAAILGCDRVWGLSIANTAVFEFELGPEDWWEREVDRWNPTLWRIHQFNRMLA